MLATGGSASSAEIGRPDSVVRADDVALGVCHFAVEPSPASGCAVTLMARPPSVEVLATAGRQRRTRSPSCSSRWAKVLAWTLSWPASRRSRWTSRTKGARWPMFSAQATELGVLAEFSLPMQLGAAPVGVLDLSREEPGMLSEEQLADALTAAEIVTDAVLLLQGASSESPSWRRCSNPPGWTVWWCIRRQGWSRPSWTSRSRTRSRPCGRPRSGRTGRSTSVAVDVVDRRISFRD